MDIGFNTRNRHESVVKMLDERHLLGGIGREEVFAEFHVKVEGVFIVLTVHRDEVLRCEGWEFRKNGFNLAGEYVNPADDKHIVATSENLTNAHCCATATTLLRNKMRKVACAVADDRHRFLTK